jgi:hypothetical protein
MKKIISIIILLFLLYSCNTNIDEKVKKYIETNCLFNDCDDWLIDGITNSYVDTCGKCNIDLKKILNIDYDKVYMFGEGTRANEISKVIGIQYKNNTFLPDSKYRMIFIKNNKIVYENDFYQGKIEFNIISGYYNESDYFVPSNIGYCLLDTSSVYRVRKTIKSDGNYYYTLFNVNSIE